MQGHLLITYQSLRGPSRQWQVRFELGSEDANVAAALRHAWTHNASIVAQAEVPVAPSA